MEDFIVYDNLISKEELIKLNIFISDKAVVQSGAKIYFNCCILGDSVVYSTAELHSNSTIIASVISNESKIFSSRIENSEIGGGSIVGPFAHIKNSEIGGNCKIGNFSIINNCQVADNVNINCLCNLVNSEIGKHTNIESGVIFSKLDNKILIGDSVHIGANSSVVSPITVSDESVIVAGSIVNKDIGFKEIASNKVKQFNSIC